MKKPAILLLPALFCGLFRAPAQQAGIPVTYEEAVEMVRDNRSMQLASQGVEWARNERQRLNAYWYPSVTAGGAYVRMGNPIAVKESLSTFTDPVKNFIHSIDPGEQLVTSLLDRIGSHSFSVPMAPADVTTIDATATLPVFTGGKRIYAGRIGKAAIGAAEANRQQVNADQHVLLVETYFGLRLGREIVEVRKQTLDAFELHYRNALKLEAAGMLTKTERLIFQVTRDEAKRELETAVNELEVTQNAFKTLVQMENDGPILPVTPLFIDETMPPAEYFKERVARNNYLIRGLEFQQEIEKKQLKIANSAYMPEIGVFWKQTLYSHGIRKNLVPRWLVGVGFTWNIFDGLGREKQIRQAKINNRMIATERRKTEEDLSLAADKFYHQTQIALDNAAALETTLEMSREIVRARQKSFAEGMATSTEVVDAELMLAQAKVAMLMAYYQFDTGLINLLAVSGMPEDFSRYARTGRNENSIPNREPASTNQIRPDGQE